LNEPLSPHAAAAIDGVTIALKNFQLPQTDNHLIVELAGGLMVPLNNDTLNIDLIKQLSIPVILVVKNYLGSINHTLLSIEILKVNGINLKGLIFNGTENKASEEFILNYTKVPLIGKVAEEQNISKEIVQKYATQFRTILCD
jgi:dethiobiotin synthetase